FNLKNQAFKISAAYHLALNKKATSILSFGYQTGSVSRKIGKMPVADPNGMEQYPDLLEVDMGLINELKAGYTEHVGGLHLKAQINDENLLQLGASVGHIGRTDIALVQPDSGGVGGSRYELPMRFLGHG